MSKSKRGRPPKYDDGRTKYLLYIRAFPWESDAILDKLDPDQRRKVLLAEALVATKQNREENQ